MPNFTNYTVCNMMTGSGFSTDFFGGFAMAWLGVVILFFLIAFGRRWVGEEMDYPFSFVGGLVGAFLPYIIIVLFTCSYKLGLLGGIIGGVVGAFFAGNFFGDDGGFSFG